MPLDVLISHTAGRLGHEAGDAVPSPSASWSLSLPRPRGSLKVETMTAIELKLYDYIKDLCVSYFNGGRAGYSGRPTLFFPHYQERKIQITTMYSKFPLGVSVELIKYKSEVQDRVIR